MKNAYLVIWCAHVIKKFWLHTADWWFYKIIDEMVRLIVRLSLEDTSCWQIAMCVKNCRPLKKQRDVYLLRTQTRWFVISLIFSAHHWNTTYILCALRAQLNWVTRRGAVLAVDLHPISKRQSSEFAAWHWTRKSSVCTIEIFYISQLSTVT